MGLLISALQVIESLKEPAIVASQNVEVNMRMWNISPELLCDKHLRGEHNEMHMFEGTIRKGINISGYVKDNLIDTRLLQTRHDQLAIEMLARGGNHCSDMEYVDTLYQGNVDALNSLKELAYRCPRCRVRILAEGLIPKGEIPPSIDYSSVAYDKARKKNRKLTKEQFIATLPILAPAE